jgi:hypothetical protein
MRYILFLCLIPGTLLLHAQTDEIKKMLDLYQVTGDLLTTNLKDADAAHYFELHSSRSNGGEISTYKSIFDPSKLVGQRWILQSVNGDHPSAKDIRDYDKLHNTKKQDINGKVDERAWKIIKDDADSLILAFKYAKKTLPKKYDFLGHCIGRAHFNKHTGHLEKAEYVNEKPLKISAFNVNRLDMLVHYKFHEDEGVYLIHKETLDMEVKLLGQLVSIREQNEYLNYRKIK